MDGTLNVAPTCSKMAGPKKILHSQSREIIFNVYSFMKKEAEGGEPTNLKRVQPRVAEATGASVSSIKRILNEHKSGKGFTTPHKKRPRKMEKTDIDDFDKCIVRRTVNEFHRSESERPTIGALILVLKEKINFSGSTWALRKILRDLGFRWKESMNNRKLLIEKNDIRELRINFLRNLERYRKEGRPIVYTGVTYVHTSHTNGHALSNKDNTDVGCAPISKGQHIIIVHAGNEKGFVPKTPLIFKSDRKSGDYYGGINYKNYEKWLQTKLIPNLPPRSVLVADNTPFHNVQLNPAPTSLSKRQDMIDWLACHDIPFSDSMYKVELYSLMKLWKPKFKTYKLDSLLAEKGHSVLRMPRYHPDLNPIESIWVLIKDYVAKKNVNFQFNSVMQLVQQKCDLVTVEEWQSACKHSRDREQNYISLEPFIDKASEQIIDLGEDSDSNDDDDEEDDSEDDSDEEDDDDSEDDSDEDDVKGTSGIESLWDLW